MNKLVRAVSHALMYLDEDGVVGIVGRDVLAGVAQKAFRNCDNPDFTVEDIVAELEAKQAIIWREATGIFSDRVCEDWLSKREIPSEFWDRYRAYLNIKEGWTPSQLDILDKDVNRVLRRLEDPQKEEVWTIKGLVVGDVQSGKTAHFTGVLNKAVDCGYQLIIVLAGIHNSLRSQTQGRLDKEFVGFDPEKKQYVGVGNPQYGNRPAKSVYQPTHAGEQGDLKSYQRIAQLGRKEPFLFVIKKNKTPLEALISWLRGQQLNQVPTLIIDDEADQASLNTSDSETNPTTLNKLVREMMSLLKQKCYVGYTATPYANAYIPVNRDDLFPEDFIIRLNPPSNYIGSARAFGYDSDPYVDIEGSHPLGLTSIIERPEDFIPRKHDKNFKPTGIPASLTLALNQFLISVSIRSIRTRIDNHSTMLVHVTKFNKVQEEISALIEAWKQDLVDIFNRGTGEQLKDLKSSLADVYKSYTGITNRVKNEIDGHEKYDLPAFDSVFMMLSQIISEKRLVTKLFNGSSSDVLDYENPRGICTIAVGGNRLSRGLTLKGLIVSYYLRYSGAYDTLMQMGRWFGYRPHYLDLCRIHISRELNDAFRHATLVNVELNRDFERMEAEHRTPRDWGLKIRNDDSGDLDVTAANKRRRSFVIPWTFKGKLVQTLSLSLYQKDVDQNFEAFSKLIQALYTIKNPKKAANRPVYIWGRLDSGLVLSFLGAYKGHKRSPSASGVILTDYIRGGLSCNEVCDWTIAVVGGEATELLTLKNTDSVPLVTRDSSLELDIADPAIIYRGIISKEDEALDFHEAPKVFGKSLRELRPSSNGLITLYPITSRKIIESFKAESLAPVDGLASETKPLIGFAISFPGKSGRKTTYTVNQVFFDQMWSDDDEDDSE
jgi:hypothetical protein